MEEILEIRKAIQEHKDVSGLKNEEIMIVIGLELKEKLNAAYEKRFGKTTGKEKRTIFGVDIVVRDEIKDLSFGIFSKECMDHLEEHLAEILEVDEEVFVNICPCDLCGHPIAADMFSNEGIAFCPWCKDRNVLQVIEIE